MLSKTIEKKKSKEIIVLYYYTVHIIIDYRINYLFYNQ